MNFSVVIPVRNRAEQIRACVAAVRAGDYPDERFEVIVVDSDSTDGTAHDAAEAGARVVNEPEPNRSLARNRGAREARGAWIAFLDSDCVPSPGWLSALERATVTAADDARVGAVAGAVADAPATTHVEAYIAARRWFDQEKYLTPDDPFERPFAITANLAVRRDVFDAVGGFDPTFTAAEDADLGWRLAEAGWRIRYAADARVTHRHRATLGALWRQSFYWGEGQADLFAKWRAHAQRRAWLKPRLYVWALKGLLKAPWAWCMGRTPLARREPFYDCVANTAMALGRLRGALRQRVWMI